MKKLEMLKIMAKVDSFPSMPAVALKMLKLIEKPDTSPSQIELVIGYDPGLTANMLKLTNSAYFGLPNRVGSVRQAVVLLGWKKLTHLVLASCVHAVMDEPVPGYDLPPGELWKHSISVSVAAETLVKEMRIAAADEVFTAALLHDIGKLVLGNYVKEDLKRIEAETARGLSFEAAEYRVLGTDHTEIGAQILKKWMFPDSVVRAVRYHHEPESLAKPDTLVDIVHVANVLTLMIGMGGERTGLRLMASTAAAARLGLRESHLELVASKTLQHTRELSEIFGLKRGD